MRRGFWPRWGGSSAARRTTKSCGRKGDEVLEGQGGRRASWRFDEMRSGKEDDELLGDDEEELLDCGDKTSSLAARRTRSSSVARRIPRFLAAVGATRILAEMGRRSFSDEVLEP